MGLVPSSRIVRNWSLTFVLGAGLTAAEPPADGAGYLPQEPVAVLRLGDVPRSVERLAATPYADLSQTPWGQLVAVAAGAHCADIGIDPSRALNHIRSIIAGFGFAGPPFARRPSVAISIATAGGAESMADLCARIYPIEAPLHPPAQRAWIGAGGQITQVGDLFVFTNAGPGGGAPAAPPVQSDPPVALDGECDLEGTFAPASLRDAIAALSPPSAMDSMGCTLHVGITLDAIGLREHIRMPFPPAQTESLKDLAWPVVDPMVFASLPADTLCAVAMRTEPGITSRFLFQALKDGGPDAVMLLDVLMLHAGLPGLVELLGGLDGDLVVYLQDGAPFPSITIAAGMQEAVGQQTLHGLAANVGMVRNPDGSFTGIVADIIPLHATMHAGQLVITTHPHGIAAYRDRTGGFADHPAVIAALAELPPDALALGVSRSGPSWEAVARLAMVPLAQHNLPQFWSLPKDLGAAGRHGFLAYRMVDGVVHIDGGGLLGGPATWYGLISGVAALAGLTLDDEGLPPGDPDPLERNQPATEMIF